MKIIKQELEFEECLKQQLDQEKVKQDILQQLCDGENLKSLEQEINNINSKSIIIKN